MQEVSLIATLQSINQMNGNEWMDADRFILQPKATDWVNV